jgi:hypothetical protein
MWEFVIVGWGEVVNVCMPVLDWHAMVRDDCDCCYMLEFVDVSDVGR